MVELPQNLQSLCCLSQSNMSMSSSDSQILPLESNSSNSEIPFSVLLESICNLTTPDKCQDILRNLMQPKVSKLQIVLLVVLVVLFLVGTTGNILVIICVTGFRRMRTVSHVFLLNLACSDLLVFLICEPFTISSIINRDWMFGVTLCRLTAVFQGTSIGVSIFTLTSICVERYVVIVGRGFNHNRFNSRHLLVWVLSIWVASFVISSPLLQAYEVQKMELPFSSPTRFCMETWLQKALSKEAFTSSIFVLFYLLPLIFMSILYTKVALYLNKSTAVLQNIQTSPKERISLEKPSTDTVRKPSKMMPLKRIGNSRQRISKLLLILTLLFALFWLPYHAVNLFLDFFFSGVNRKNLGQHDLGSSFMVDWLNSYGYHAAQMLAYANNAINPVCTLIISRKFRSVLSQIRHCSRYSATTDNSRFSRAPATTQIIRFQ